MPLVQAYTPPSLHPLEAQFLNVLLTRNWAHGFDFHGRHCSFKADPWQSPFIPACRLNVEAEGALWQIAFSSSAPLGLHPAGAQIATAPDLPDGLRLALFELAFAPALTALADFFDLKTLPEIRTETNEPLEDFVCLVPLLLRLPDETVAVTVCIPNHDDANALLLRLSEMPCKRNPVPSLRLMVTLEAGSMRLTMPELLALKPDDILLPAIYPACEGELCLRLSPVLGIRCAVDNKYATTLGFEYGFPCPGEEETRREAMPDTLPDGALQEKDPANEGASPQAAINLDTLELAVTFELERKLMSIAEISALTPGYTFPLSVQPNGPVTLRANGKRLGTGRLVDIGGTLGVQLIQLEQET